jgi:hypothetical protein
MKETVTNKYLYWVPEEDFKSTRDLLEAKGFKMSAAFMTPCQVMHAKENRVHYAPPAVWTRICRRQATWYLSSRRAGQTMLMSARRLPAELDGYLDAELTPTDFQPEKLPSSEELQSLVDSDAYTEQKPKGWEAIGLKDAVIFKFLFTLTRFWGLGDNLKRFWLSQRANHANFLARHFTTRLDGEEVPYSVTENAGVCSSCAEFFNVVEDGSRKLVRACPGSVIFGGAERDAYLDVKPVQITVGLPLPIVETASAKKEDRVVQKQPGQ